MFSKTFIRDKLISLTTDIYTNAKKFMVIC